MLSVSTGFKNALKELGTYSDGKVDINNGVSTLSFNRDTITKIEVFGTAFNEGKIIGNIAKHALTVELLGDLTSSIDLSTTNIIQPYYGVLVSGVYEYVQLQDFYITSIEYSDTSNLTTIAATDSLIKLNKNFVDDVIYPITLKNFVIHVLNQCDLALENTTFLNDDYVIEEAPFSTGVAITEVMSKAAEITMSFIKVNKVSNKIEFANAYNPVYRGYTHQELQAFTHTQLAAYTHYQLENAVPLYEDYIGKDNYWEFKQQDYVYGQYGVNTLSLTTAKVEGENVVRQETTLAAQDGVIEVTIIDNPFINTEAKRQLIVDKMFTNVLKYKYKPYSIDYRGYPHIEVGDRIRVEAMDGSFFYAPIYEITLRWDGGLYGQLKAEALNKTETLYPNTSPMASRVKNAEIMVDKVAGEITLVASEVDNLENRIAQTELLLEPEAFTISVRNITNDQFGETIANVEKNFIFNADGLEINSSENSFSIKIDETEMGFYDSGNKMAYIGNSDFNINRGRVESQLIIGVHKIEKYSSGITVFRYIGE